MKEKVPKALRETHGSNDNIKVKVKVGGEKYVYIKVHVPLPAKNAPNELLKQSKDELLLIHSKLNIRVIN